MSQVHDHRGFVPVACRFVPYDQWLLTHLHNDWIIKQVKHWILAKCNLAKPPDAPQRRSSSPIIFTPISAEDCLVGEDEEYPDETQHDWLNPDKLYGQSAVLCASPTDSPTAGGFLADRYTLISFSTGTILEDNQTISWYKLRPHELLEIHRSGTVVSLPREVAMNYVQPYFHARIKALLAVWSHKSGRFKPPGHSTEHEIGHKKRDRPTPPRWKPKLEWKDRWVVIHNDILSLAKDTAEATARHQFSLATLQVLRGADSLRQACAIVTDQRVVCIKFRTIKPKIKTDTPFASPSTRSTAEWKTTSSKTTSSSGSAKTSEKWKFKRTSREPYNPDDVCRGEGEWVVLDMLDDHAFTNILRVLHRYAPHPISSSFLPSSALGGCCASEVKPFLREHSSTVIPYPEWRVNIVDTARKVGMGDVGKPMAWVLWPETGPKGGSFLPGVCKRQQALSQRDPYPPSTVSSPSDSDPETDEYGDSDSELEWDGWTKDLDRQSLVRQHATGYSKTSYTQLSISSSLSSPLLPHILPHHASLTNLHAKTSLEWTSDQPISGDRYKPQSSRILSRHSADVVRSPIKTTDVGAVKVDSPSSSRRRSASVSPGMLARLTKDIGKFNIGQPSATSEMSGASPNLHVLHDAPLLKNLPRKAVRPTRSSSNLFSRASFHDSEHSWRGGVLPPLPVIKLEHQHSYVA